MTFRNLEPGEYRIWVRAQNSAGKGPRTQERVTVEAVSAVEGGAGDPEPQPVPQQQPDPQQQQQAQESSAPACMDYDANGNGVIDAEESVAASIDYGNGVITLELMMQVLNRCG